MGIPPDLHQRLIAVLLRCESFENDRALRAVFADARIDSWKHKIPHAESPDERTKKVADYLHRQANEHGENALVLLLWVLCEQIPPADARHQELATLAEELEHEFELRPPQPEVPESFAQKFLRSFTGDTEAQRAYRNRQAMLKLVHNTWIKGVLEQSLHGAALIELGMDYDPTAVDHPWDMVVQMPERPDKAVPPGTHIADVFDDVGDSLLILGEPGSGKTTMLLELARDLIARAEQDDMLHIPVVFNLSSWAVKQQPLLHEWLIEELRTKYYIPKKVAQAWIRDDVLLLLLDGLDEVKAEARDKYVEAINVFHQAHLVPLVVCSRTADYAALTAKLHLLGAIGLRPLTPTQIDAYLAGAGTELQAVRATLKHDPVLQEMTESPLFLSIMTLAYSGLEPADLQSLTTPEARRQHLFDTYTERMFRRRTKADLYMFEQTCHWLGYLAKGMTAKRQSIFLVNSLDIFFPRAKSEHFDRLAHLVNVLIAGISCGLSGGVYGGLLGGVLGGLVFGLIVLTLLLSFTWNYDIARIGFYVGLFCGTFGGLVGGLVKGLFGRLVKGLSGGLFFGLLGGIAYYYLDWMISPHWSVHHFILLANLVRVNHAPWNYVRFLDYCVDRIFLRKVGGGYIFVHRLLQEYFASLTPEDIERIAGDSRASV